MALLTYQHVARERSSESARWVDREAVIQDMEEKMDWEHERVIPLRDVPKHVPSRVSGKRIAPSTVFRWAQQRKNPLETFRTPGGRFTSIEAIGRFLDGCTAAAGNDAGTAMVSTDAPGILPTSQRALKAGLELANLIGSKRPRGEG